jgi:hypothetical protein
MRLLKGVSLDMFGFGRAEPFDLTFSMPMSASGPVNPETFLATQLAKEPFNRNLNAATFQHMGRETILEVECECRICLEICKKQSVSILFLDQDFMIFRIVHLFLL